MLSLSCLKKQRSTLPNFKNSYLLGQGFPKGAKISKGGDLKICGNELILYILELQMKSKKKVLDVYIGNFETYTIYSEIADEKRGRLPF